LFDLLNAELPAQVLGGRFGVQHYAAPTLVESLYAISDESRLLHMLRHALCPMERSAEDWTGSLDELRGELVTGSGREAELLLGKSNVALGMLLGKLRNRFPKIFTQQVKKMGGTATRIWTIQASQLTDMNRHWSAGSN